MDEVRKSTKGSTKWLRKDKAGTHDDKAHPEDKPLVKQELSDTLDRPRDGMQTRRRGTLLIRVILVLIPWFLGRIDPTRFARSARSVTVVPLARLFDRDGRDGIAIVVIIPCPWMIAVKRLGRWVRRRRATDGSDSTRGHAPKRVCLAKVTGVEMREKERQRKSDIRVVVGGADCIGTSRTSIAPLVRKQLQLRSYSWLFRGC